MKDFLGDGDGGGAKGVLGEDGGGRAGGRGGDEGEVGEARIACFDANMGAGGEEAFGVGAGRGDVFLFGGRDGAVDRGGILADLDERISLASHPPHAACEELGKKILSFRSFDVKQTRFAYTGHDWFGAADSEIICLCRYRQQIEVKQIQSSGQRSLLCRKENHLLEVQRL